MITQQLYVIVVFPDASSSATTSCLVNYESSLTLHCPNTTTNSSSHGEWWKQNPTTGRTQGVCYDRNCTLYEPLHNEDTAVYFCQMSDRKYYVNVTVLGMNFVLMESMYDIIAIE
jgi:hypothetical protein